MYAIAVKWCVGEKVHLAVTGQFQLPLSENDLKILEQAACDMPFFSREKNAEFIVTLPEGLALTGRQAVRIDNAIFRGLIVRGKKGSWSSLSSYPASDDYPT